jgi:hypothetical protein
MRCWALCCRPWQRVTRLRWLWYVLYHVNVYNIIQYLPLQSDPCNLHPKDTPLPTPGCSDKLNYLPER